jgi:hypothetical protein
VSRRTESPHLSGNATRENGDPDGGRLGRLRTTPPASPLHLALVEVVRRRVTVGEFLEGERLLDRLRGLGHLAADEE